MLGYAFMGKAHSNAFKKIGVHDVAAAARAEARRHRGTQHRGGRRGGAQVRVRVRNRRLARADRGRADRPLRQRRPELAARRADDRRRPSRQARDLREAARARRRRKLRHLAAGRGHRRQAHVRVQLPLRAGRPARAGADRGGRAGGDPAFSRPVPAGLGRRRDARHVALPPGRGGLGCARRSRYACRRSRTVPGR